MIEFRQVSKAYGPLQLFTELDFSVDAAGITCILGPSGCGKTTLLDMAAGLIHCDSGEILSPARISYVFQEPRLLPWMSIRDNAGYALDMNPKGCKAKTMLDEMLELMELNDAAEKLPGEVSGGMARRCALARALLAPSEAVLMDEPLSSLDPDLRNRILERLPDMLNGRPALLVTHDYGVASVLSDKVFKLSDPPVKVTPVNIGELETVIRQIEERV